MLKSEADWREQLLRDLRKGNAKPYTPNIIRKIIEAYPRLTRLASGAFFIWLDEQWEGVRPTGTNLSPQEKLDERNYRRARRELEEKYGQRGQWDSRYLPVHVERTPETFITGAVKGRARAMRHYRAPKGHSSRTRSGDGKRGRRTWAETGETFEEPSDKYQYGQAAVAWIENNHPEKFYRILSYMQTRGNLGRIFQLHFKENRSGVKIANEMKIDPPSVSRTIKSIRKLFEREGLPNPRQMRPIRKKAIILPTTKPKK